MTTSRPPLIRPRTLALLTLAAALVSAPAPRAESELELQYSVIAPLAVESLLLDGAVAGARIVVVGERGHVLVSDDGGRSWTQIRVPTVATLTAVDFADARNGWAVGHDMVILRTRDGGDSWERIFADPEQERPLLDVWFRDPRHGVAVGAYGLYMETADGGDTWETRVIDEEWDPHLNDVVPARDGRVYIAAEAGSFYVSADGGASWDAVATPYEGSYFGALPVEPEALLLFGLRGHLFRSEDAGESWEAIPTETTALLTDAARQGDATTVVVAGLAGVVLVSEDGGGSFTTSVQPDRGGIAAVVTAADGGLIQVGEFGVRRLPPGELVLAGGKNR